MAKIKRTLKKNKVVDANRADTTQHQPLRFCPACHGEGEVNDVKCRPCKGGGKVLGVSYGPALGESPQAHTYL